MDGFDGANEFGRVTEVVTSSGDEGNVLNELRKKGQLTDAVIKVDNRRFHIHRPILLACSNYFKNFFTNDTVNTNHQEVVISHVSADMMDMIIDFAYTGKVKVTSDNVEQLLPMAEELHITGISKACCDFMLENLLPENCIGVNKFAKTYYCQNLEKSSYRYLLRHFSDVCIRSNEYLQMNIEDVMVLLSSDDLNAKSEEMVFEAIVRWVDYDPMRRKSYMPKLLRSIRLGLLPTEYFVEKVKSHVYVKDSEQCKPVIVETLKFLYDLDIGEDREVDLTNPLAKPRVPHEVLFVVGGWSGGSPTNLVETYDARADRWVVVCDALDFGPRAYHGTAVVSAMIYVVGGFDGTEYFNTVRCYDSIKKCWSERAPMHSKRCYVSITAMDGMIYAMGGFNGETRHSSAERYNPKTNQWSMIMHMNQRRSDASATNLNGLVYICGGFNGHECLSSAEYFNPEINQWTMIPNMRSRRSGIGIIAFRDHVYAVGGFNGVSRLKTGECYDPQTNRWKPLPEMYHPRSNFAIEVIDDMVFAIGGFDGTSTIYNVECYDDITDQWYDATDMNLYRSALSACVVTDIPNIRDYTHKTPVQPQGKGKEDDRGEQTSA